MPGRMRHCRRWRGRFSETGVSGVEVIAKGRWRRSWLPDAWCRGFRRCGVLDITALAGTSQCRALQLRHRN